MTAPSQDALFPQALAAMTRREAEFGRVPDDDTRRIAEYATVLGVRNNYGQITDIAFNKETPKLAAGDRFFVLDNDPGNPAGNRESMLTRDALAATPKQVGDDMQAALAQRTQVRDAEAHKLTEKRELDVPTRSA